MAQPAFNRMGYGPNQGFGGKGYPMYRDAATVYRFTFSPSGTVSDSIENGGNGAVFTVFTAV